MLTDRQRNDLEAAILDYFLSKGDQFSQTIASFQQEGSVMKPSDSKGLLEKKWTAVVRLQKRVMELEAKLEQLQQQRGNPSAEDSGPVDMTKLLTDSRLLPKGPARHVLSGHRAPITIVACHPVFSVVASGSEDATIKIWDHETAVYEKTLKGHTGSVTGLAYDPRGKLLASCSADMTAKLWDTDSYTCVKTLKGHDHSLSAVLFLPSGDQLLTCSRDESIKLWEVSNGFCTKTYNGHSDWVRCISISLDGEYIASGGVDQSIIIWQTSTAQRVHVRISILSKLMAFLTAFSYRR